MTTMTTQQPPAAAADDDNSRPRTAGDGVDRAGQADTAASPTSVLPGALGVVATNELSIDDMRVEIDAIDTELVRLIRRRTELSQAIGAARQSQGGTRIVYSREIQILERFRELGPAGTELGMLLLSLGRGTLGRK
jgi:chorismate mutase